jgi:cysteine desulfurase
MTIYLDYQATTPLAAEAKAAMTPWLDKYGNPHSPHRMGREAAAAVEVARDQVLSLLKSRFGMDRSGAGRLIFTSGATEAANFALKGAAWAAPPTRTRIVTLASEHACVLDTVQWLGRTGYEATILPVDANGLVDLDELAEAVDERTAVVAVMLVNNEIGVIQPVEEIAQIARAAGALYLCDAVQGLGRVPLPDADLIAISAHKIHGPKGIGALWVRDGVALEPLMHGGAQEGGMRSGTLSPMLCAGFGAAAAAVRLEEDAGHVAQLWDAATQRLQGWTINGSIDRRYLGNLNIRMAGLDAARLISDVRNVAFSAGSACASGSGRPSHVLKALGLSDADARTSIRLGFGRYTTEAELTAALDLILAAAEQQRAFA